MFGIAQPNLWFGFLTVLGRDSPILFGNPAHPHTSELNAVV